LRVEVREEIREAIEEAAQAGVYRRAERLNPGSADVWSALAEPHSRRVAALTDKATGRRSQAVNRPETF
jgi:hypothetical protein